MQIRLQSLDRFRMPELVRSGGCGTAGPAVPAVRQRSRNSQDAGQSIFDQPLPGFASITWGRWMDCFNHRSNRPTIDLTYRTLNDSSSRLWDPKAAAPATYVLCCA